MLAPALRPRGVGEILDTAFQLYRSRWKEMATATGVIVLPLLMLEAIAPLEYLGFLESLSNLFFLAASAAVVAIASGAYRGEDVDAVDAIRAVGGRFLSVWGAAIIQGIAVGVGLLLLVIPGIFMAALTFAMQQAVMIEGKTASEALARSQSLAKGHMKQIILTSVMAFIITFTFMIGVGIAIGYFVPSPRLSTLLVNVVLVPLNPLGAAVGTVLYYDLRIRKEAYDVTVAADRLGSVEAAPAL